MKDSGGAVDGLIELDIKEAINDRYFAYALSTIMSRSLPDSRDGLKPVHRRLLYAMSELRLRPEAAFKKCARIVGDVMGKYHPHGDAAIYDSLVRMAQDFSLRYPTIEGQGNFGSIDGDSHASMRYTEAKLTDYALLLLDGLHEDSVDFRDNYDGVDVEPSVLPTCVPNLLANGAEGIAVGMATSIPPHNLIELCNACVHMLKHPECSVDTLLKHVKGPDFPTGCTLIATEEQLCQIYASGKGSVRVRAKWEVEDLPKGQYQIVITEIPYQVQKRSIMEKISVLYEQKKLPFVSDVEDYSDSQIRVVVTPRSRNIPAEHIMEALFKLTDLEQRIQFNMNAIDSNSVPRLMSLRDLLESFLMHTKGVTIRRHAYERRKIEARLNIIEGLLIVYNNLDAVIRIIRYDDDPRAKLMLEYSLNTEQVDAIMNMRLGSLRKLEEEALTKEFSALSERLKEIIELLSDEVCLQNYMIAKLRALISSCKKDELYARRTEVLTKVPESVEISSADFIEKEPISVTCSAKGWLRAVKGYDNFSSVKYKEGDLARFELNATTRDPLIFASDRGRCYSLEGHMINTGRGHGANVSMIFNMTASDETIVDIHIHDPSKKYIVASEQGRGFIISGEHLISQTKAGKKIMNCEKMFCCTEVVGDTIVLVSARKKLLAFNISELPEMKGGKGVILQKYGGDSLLDLKVVNLETGVEWKTPKGVKRRLDVKAWVGKRGSSGKLVLNKIWV